jgi:transposase
MFEDDAQGGCEHIDDVPRSGRRRRWSAADKARIVAETWVPGERVSDVARRWRVCSQQIYRWRHAAAMMRRSPEQTALPAFVPIVAATNPHHLAGRPALAPVIEIRLAGAVVRVVAGTDDAQLRAVLRAVRTSASGA